MLKKVVLPVSDGRGVSSVFSVGATSVAFSTDGVPLSEAVVLLVGTTAGSVTFAGAV